MKSLDPRVSRLPQIGGVKPKIALDQFGTFEVFVQPKEGKPFQHEGCVHAPNLEMAYVLAKETFTRRFTCVSVYVTDTRDVLVTPTTEGDQNVYDLFSEVADQGTKKVFEVYQLSKRGKQHINAGVVEAGSPKAAIIAAKKSFGTAKNIYNVWVIAHDKIRFTTAEEKDLWTTLPEKKFRDAADYKGGEKLKKFLEKSNFKP